MSNETSKKWENSKTLIKQPYDLKIKPKPWLMIQEALTAIHHKSIKNIIFDHCIFKDYGISIDF